MKTLAFTRPADRLNESLSIVESMGMRALAAPSLDITYPDRRSLQPFLDRLGLKEYDAAIFTSATAVDALLSIGEEVIDQLKTVPMTIAIGEGTARRLKVAGFTDVAIPEEYTSDGLLACFSDVLKGQGVCILRSDKGTDILPRGLEASGAKVEEVITYHLTPAGWSEGMEAIAEAALSGAVDAYAFTSALSVRSFLALMQEKGFDAMNFLNASLLAAIGPPTAEEMVSLGLRPSLIASSADFREMIKEIRFRLDNQL